MYNTFNSPIETPYLGGNMKHSYFLYFIVLISAILNFLFPILNSNSINNPPETGDSHDYDAIAFNLINGNGFGYDWDDELFLLPYSFDSKYDFLFERNGSSLTAYRPPLFPYLLAGTYYVFGRVFFPIRLINILAISISCTLCFALVKNRFGIGVGFIYCLMIFTNPEMHEYSAYILTEALAILFVSLLAFSLIRFSETKNEKYLFSSSLIMGLAILNRSSFLPWLLPYAFLVFLLTYKNNVFYGIKKALIILIISILIQVPWMIRNCLILDDFSPFGTHFNYNMPAAYSDEALAHQGKWFNLDLYGFYDNVTSTGLKSEIEKAEIGKRLGLEWIGNNFWKLPKLAMFKVLDIWQPTNLVYYLLLIFSLIGIIKFPVKLDLLIFLFILIANSFSVAITWSSGSRFLVPTLPIIYILSLAGLISQIKFLINREGTIWSQVN